MTDRLFELAALDAAGALAPGEQQELQALMAAATPSALATVADLYEASAMLPADPSSSSLLPPSAPESCDTPARTDGQAVLEPGRRRLMHTADTDPSNSAESVFRQPGPFRISIDSGL